MFNQYETVFIATPVLSESQMKEAVAKYIDLIKANNGEVVYEEDWGLRKLAYPIQKKTTGFYHLIEFKAEPAFVDTLETQYRRDERIIRSSKCRGGHQGRTAACENRYIVHVKNLPFLFRWHNITKSGGVCARGKLKKFKV